MSQNPNNSSAWLNINAVAACISQKSNILSIARNMSSAHPYYWRAKEIKKYRDIAIPHSPLDNKKQGKNSKNP